MPGPMISPIEIWLFRARGLALYFHLIIMDLEAVVDTVFRTFITNPLERWQLERTSIYIHQTTTRAVYAHWSWLEGYGRLWYVSHISRPAARELVVCSDSPSLNIEITKQVQHRNLRSPFTVPGLVQVSDVCLRPQARLYYYSPAASFPIISTSL